MNDKLIYKIIFSIPVILIAIYLIPAIGIILIIARQFISNKKWYSTPIILLVLSAIIYLPQILNGVIQLFNINIDIINQIVNSNNYINLLAYGTTLFTIGLVFLILSAILNKIIENIINQIKKTFNNYQKKEYEINKENDLKIKEKQLRSKTTNVIICENCGASNIVTDKTAICLYCRTPIENEKV